MFWRCTPLSLLQIYLHFSQKSESSFKKKLVLLYFYYGKTNKFFCLLSLLYWKISCIKFHMSNRFFNFSSLLLFLSSSRWMERNMGFKAKQEEKSQVSHPHTREFSKVYQKSTQIGWALMSSLNHHHHRSFFIRKYFSNSSLRMYVNWRRLLFSSYFTFMMLMIKSKLSLIIDIFNTQHHHWIFYSSPLSFTTFIHWKDNCPLFISCVLSSPLSPLRPIQFYFFIFILITLNNNNNNNVHPISATAAVADAVGVRVLKWGSHS